MRTRMTLTALAAVLLMAPAEASQPQFAPPNNVRASIVQVVGDSVTFGVRWAPAPRGRFEHPITGYEVQIVAESPTGDGQIAGADTLAETARFTRVTVYHDCEDPYDRYHGRVRATIDPGDITDPGTPPWGTSAPIILTCEATLPGPPDVQVDTLPVDTVSAEADEVETTIQPLASWATVEDGGVRTEALGEAARVCAYTVRDGVRRRAGWATGMGLNPSSHDGTEIGFAPVDGIQACWDVTILAKGG